MTLRDRILAAIGYIVVSPFVVWIVLRSKRDEEMPDPIRPTRLRVSGKPEAPPPSPDKHPARSVLIYFGLAAVFAIVVYLIRMHA